MNEQYARLRAEIEALGLTVREDEPMSRHTSFAIGGPADLYVATDDLDKLCACFQLALAAKVATLLLGSGTNVLVADRGVRGLVIANECRAFAMEPDGLLVADSGVPLKRLAAWSVEEGWQGIEWAVGVPGTLGGAVVGNAGAYGGTMADIVRWVEVLSPTGERKRWDNAALEYDYRTSRLKREAERNARAVVLRAALALRPGNRDELRRIAENNTAQRKAKTPEGCCAGSVFKRTPQYPPGFLIEQAGLKGRRVGGAEVSSMHANFIMNTGNASAADVRTLMDLVQETVWKTLGQRLEPEIEFVGDWP